MLGVLAKYIFGGMMGDASEATRPDMQYHTREVNDWLLVDMPDQAIDDEDMDSESDDDDEILTALPLLMAEEIVQQPLQIVQLYEEVKDYSVCDNSYDKVQRHYVDKIRSVPSAVQHHHSGDKTQGNFDEAVSLEVEDNLPSKIEDISANTVPEIISKDIFQDKPTAKICDIVDVPVEVQKNSNHAAQEVVHDKNQSVLSQVQNISGDGIRKIKNKSASKVVAPSKDEIKSNSVTSNAALPVDGDQFVLHQVQNSSRAQIKEIKSKSTAKVVAPCDEIKSKSIVKVVAPSPRKEVKKNKSKSITKVVAPSPREAIKRKSPAKVVSSSPGDEIKEIKSVAKDLAPSLCDEIKEMKAKTFAQVVAHSPIDAIKETENKSVAKVVAPSPGDAIKETENKSVAKVVAPSPVHAIKETENKSVAKVVAPSLGDAIKETENKSVTKVVAPSPGNAIKEIENKSVAKVVAPSPSDVIKEIANKSVAKVVAPSPSDAIKETKTKTFAQVVALSSGDKVKKIKNEYNAQAIIPSVEESSIDIMCGITADIQENISGDIQNISSDPVFHADSDNQIHSVYTEVQENSDKIVNQSFIKAVIPTHMEIESAYNGVLDYVYDDLRYFYGDCDYLEVEENSDTTNLNCGKVEMYPENCNMNTVNYPPVQRKLYSQVVSMGKNSTDLGIEEYARNEFGTNFNEPSVCYADEIQESSDDEMDVISDDEMNDENSNDEMDDENSDAEIEEDSNDKTRRVSFNITNRLSFDDESEGYSEDESSDTNMDFHKRFHYLPSKNKEKSYEERKSNIKRIMHIMEMFLGQNMGLEVYQHFDDPLHFRCECVPHCWHAYQTREHPHPLQALLVKSYYMREPLGGSHCRDLLYRNAVMKKLKRRPLSIQDKSTAIDQSLITNSAEILQNLINQKSVPPKTAVVLEHIKELKPAQQAIQFDNRKYLTRSQLNRQNRNYIYQASTKTNRRRNLQRNHSGANNNRKC